MNKLITALQHSAFRALVIHKKHKKPDINVKYEKRMQKMKL